MPRNRAILPRASQGHLPCEEMNRFVFEGLPATLLGDDVVRQAPNDPCLESMAGSRGQCLIKPWVLILASAVELCHQTEHLDVEPN